MLMPWSTKQIPLNSEGLQRAYEVHTFINSEIAKAIKAESRYLG